MAVRVRQTYIQQPQHTPEQPIQQPVKSPRRKQKWFSAQEKLLFLLFTVVVAVLAVTILHTQGSIQTTSMEIQATEADIRTLNNENVDLKVRVSELSTYERIWDKAKELGLTLNEKNVKVVPGQ